MLARIADCAIVSGKDEQVVFEDNRFKCSGLFLDWRVKIQSSLMSWQRSVDVKAIQQM